MDGIEGRLKPATQPPLLLRPRNVTFVALAAVAIAIAEAFVDALTWVQLDVASIFGLPLLLAALTRSRSLLWTLAAALTIATFVVYAVQIPAGMFALTETFFVNRLFDVFAMLLTAGLLHVWIVLVDRAEAQNEQLEAANSELLRHQEQIARQNEELERRRSEAEETSARKTQFLASASHDIRTPVYTITLMAELIRRTAENPALAAQVPGLAQRLQANARSLADLLSSVLDSVHLESGRVEFHETTFSLDAMLTSICSDLGPAAQAKGLQLAVDKLGQAIWLRTDRMKLQRVISNLVGNAIKFTERGGVTLTAAAMPDRGAMICVKDTGAGLASHQIGAIFTEFAQLHNAAASANTGWGLGLAICRRLVKLIGGSITVESELNHGSTFKVQLPARCVVEESRGGIPGAAMGG